MAQPKRISTILGLQKISKCQGLQLELNLKQWEICLTMNDFSTITVC